MSGLLLCGKTAQRPLRIQEADINLYSAEELCYYLYNNIYMTGPDFFDENLLEFVEKELQLEKVAKKLKDQKYRDEPYVNMIQTILEGSNYYSDEEKADIMGVLAELGNKSVGERMKARADLLAEKGKYESSIRTYKMLLGKNYDSGNVHQTGCIWNNMGVVYTKLFLYREALDCFRKACDISEEQEFRDNLICAFLLTDDGDEGELSDIKRQYELTEGLLEKYREAIEMARREAREKSENLPEDTDELIKMWKREYREQIQ